MRAATALFSLHVAVALFGFAALFGKWIALAPVELVLGRTIVAALALAVLARGRAAFFGGVRSRSRSSRIVP